MNFLQNVILNVNNDAKFLLNIFYKKTTNDTHKHEMFTFTGEIDKVEKPFNDSLLEKVSFKNSESNFYSFKGSLNEIDLQQSSTFMVVPFYIGKSLEKEPIRG